MADLPGKPFNRAAQGLEQERKTLTQEELLGLNPARDQDHTGRAFEPRLAPGGGTSRAPRGMTGTQRDLPTPQHQKAQAQKTPEKAGDLKREFRPIARGQDKDRSIDR